jgi:Fe-S cluster assembly iron-binding protein IscA
VFELTSRAAAALAETCAKSGLGHGIAIRICASQANGGSSGAYQLRYAAEPFPDDVVISTAGATVFLAAGVADRLADSVLDSEKTANGSKLVLKHRPLS